ncbi:protein-L-isoaspartate(D-aspartate) O-methyltransferase [Sphingomicrobium clamense]|uniref:Protein-L-isoaspartate O-methyltransferase n=1 Tax=Sphingomicrobium clamense TaxID=2851013 RepID=A0ABS6V5E9_9SPHN|nr:protein-L-isoaspartate(D-aspartate) O-methyltransferase [Sphingomicrobium sp. B8]MBW0144575.1 protein-L-isoaspartate(D-aspartate) O-methyltransferase [Sphingomicrobium sp. B8]
MSRLAMVRDQIAARGISDLLLLEAMRRVPRHLFVPPSLVRRAVEDCALPIGEGQTISQPYIAALMIEAAQIEPGHAVLEVGSGSGYVAALLATMGAQVTAIEVVPALCDAAQERVAALGLSIVMRCGDGKAGAPDKAPFQSIIVSATGSDPPDALVEQLDEGGRLVMPVRGRRGEILRVLTKSGDWLDDRPLGAVRFVPLV